MSDHIEVLKGMRFAAIDDYFIPDRGQRDALDAAIAALSQPSGEVYQWRDAYGAWHDASKSFYDACTDRDRRTLYAAAPPQAAKGEASSPKDVAWWVDRLKQQEAITDRIAAERDALIRQQDTASTSPEAAVGVFETVAASLEQMTGFEFRLTDQVLPDDCLEVLNQAAALLRRLAPKAGDGGLESLRESDRMLADIGAICRNGPYLGSYTECVRQAYAAALSAPKAGAQADTGTVADIPDAELLRRAVRHLAPRARRRQPAWARIMDVFGLGSTYSTQLCRRFNVDPDNGKALTPRDLANKENG